MPLLMPPELEDVVKVYAKVKRLVLDAEQSDPEQKSNIAIIKEQSCALDHLMRYLGDACSEPQPEGAHQDGNLRAARSHLIRVGFDSLDDLGISLKLRINKAISGHTNEAISAVIPKYFSEYVAKIIDIDRRVVKSRADKDVGSFRTEDLNDYAQTIEDFKAIAMEIDKVVPAMVKFDENARRWRFRWRDGLWFVIGVIVTVIITFYVTKWMDAGSSSTPSKAPTNSASSAAHP